MLKKLEGGSRLQATKALCDCPKSPRGHTYLEIRTNMPYFPAAQKRHHRCGSSHLIYSLLKVSPRKIPFPNLEQQHKLLAVCKRFRNARVHIGEAFARQVEAAAHIKKRFPFSSKIDYHAARHRRLRAFFHASDNGRFYNLIRLSANLQRIREFNSTPSARSSCRNGTHLCPRF